MDRYSEPDCGCRPGWPIGAGCSDEGAALVESALADATCGTVVLLLASQQARINAARVDLALAHLA